MGGLDLFSIEGKTALVTGGSSGIGLMIARGYLEAGARVFICSRTVEVADRVVKELSEIGPIESVPADLSTEDECRRLADEIGSRVDRLDILVNNAGANWRGPLEEWNDAAWNVVLDLNVKGVFHLTHHCLPLLQAAGSVDDPARIINIGSINGLKVPMLETYSYSASKAAVHMLTRHLARRLAPTVTVNAVAPGPFESKLMTPVLEVFGEQLVSAAPMKRIGRPDDMAGIAIYLASRAGAYLTGAVIPVDGGLSTVN